MSRFPGPPLEDPPESPPRNSTGAPWGERGGTTGAPAATSRGRRSVAGPFTCTGAQRREKPRSGSSPRFASPPVLVSTPVRCGNWWTWRGVTARRSNGRGMKPSAKSVRFDDDSLWVGLDDGRVVGVPLAWFPRLLAATAEQRAGFELSPARPPLGSAGRGHLHRRPARGAWRSPARPLRGRGGKRWHDNGLRWHLPRGALRATRLATWIAWALRRRGRPP